MPPIQVSKRLLLINSGSTVVRRVLSVAVLFWMHQHLIRRIPTEEYVLLPVLMSVIALTPLISSALAMGLGRYLTEAHAAGDDRRVTEITSTMTPLLASLAVLMLGGAAAFACKIDAILDIAPSQVENAQLMLILLVIGAALRVAFGPFVLGFFVRQRFVQRDMIGFAAELLRIGLLVYLLGFHGPRVLWVVVASLAAGILELAITFVLSRRLLPALRFERGAMRRDVLRPVLSFGGWHVVGQASTLLREMADPLLLNKLATAGDVVTFNLGTQVERNLRRTVQSAHAVAQPAATVLATTEQEQRLRRTWFRMSRYSLWVMLGMATPFVVFRTEFFQLYLREAFERNQAAPIVLALLMTRFLVIFAESGVGMVGMARARMRSVAGRSFLLELSNLAFALVLVGALGLGSKGSALATCCVAFVGHPLLIWRLGLNLTGARFGEWLRVSILPGLLPMLGAAPVWVAMQHYARPASWLELGQCAFAGWGAYLLVLLLTLRPEDRKDYETIVRRFTPGRRRPVVAKAGRR